MAKVAYRVRAPINRIFELLQVKGDFVYLSVKDKRYIPVYIKRHMIRRQDFFEYAMTRVKVKNMKDLEAIQLYEVYRKT